MLLGVNSLLKTTADAATMTAKIGDKLNDLGLTNDAINAKIDDVFRKKRVLTSADVTERIKDSSWVSHSMMTRSLEYEAGDDMLRFFSSADLKFEDTSLGGNYVINPRPQFTRYADPRAKGIMSGVSDVSVAEDKGRFGMGHYYAEAIDDTHQTIHLRFGLPEFNSMLGYVRNFFNNGLNRLASRGRVTPGISDFLYYGSKLIVGWSFKALHLIEYALKTVTSFFAFVAKVPGSKYYYLRPTMVVYWAAVNNMVNMIASYRGWTNFTGDITNPDLDNKTRIKSEIKTEEDKQAGNYMHQFMPDIFSETGYINVYQAATRAGRLRLAVNNEINDAMEKSGSIEDFKKFTEDFLDNKRMYDKAELAGSTLDMAWDAYRKSGFGDSKESGPDSLLSNEKAMRSSANESSERQDPTKPPKGHFGQDLSNWAKHTLAINKDAAEFATFRVDHTGSVEESFQSSTGETDIAQKFNSASAQGRAAKFSLFGGNIDGGPLDAVKNGLASIIEGGISGIPFIGSTIMPALKAGAGAAYADIPEYWQNSSASMPRMSYTMQLVAPYGNPLSQMINIYIPLCMILAGALPLSTGKQSYTSPFLCQVFDQGRCQTRLGIIDSLQITRGVSNLGFNKKKQAMAIDVSFTIKDLSTVMHMPIVTGFAFDPLEGIFDEDTIFTDYISVLASNNLGKNIYVAQKFNKRLMARYRQIQQMASPSFWSGYLHDMTPLGMLDVFFKETDRT